MSTRNINTPNTRDAKFTIIERIQKDHAFAVELLKESFNNFVEGEAALTRLTLRDLIEGTVTYSYVAKKTKLSVKMVENAFSLNGEPSLRLTSSVFKIISEHLKVSFINPAIFNTLVETLENKPVTEKFNGCTFVNGFIDLENDEDVRGTVSAISELNSFIKDIFGYQASRNIDSKMFIQDDFFSSNCILNNCLFSEIDNKLVNMIKFLECLKTFEFGANDLHLEATRLFLLGVYPRGFDGFQPSSVTCALSYTLSQALIFTKLVNELSLSTFSFNGKALPALAPIIDSNFNLTVQERFIKDIENKLNWMLIITGKIKQLVNDAHCGWAEKREAKLVVLEAYRKK